ncbi:N-acetylglucosamine-6-phosphate deacetylase [Pararhodobacter oceanensis]|uniref:N-acetylglucosamine-6-phosphate deacetylase n=1 Tax=Pararhodobacter oceanensis TaxID=2172121 RepID=UPI003A92CEC7
MSLTAYTGAAIFDGTTRHHAHALLIEGAQVQGVIPKDDLPAHAEIQQLNGGLICPGFVDLQVNGGGGVMFNDAQTPATLRKMRDAHASLGTTAILPTLITDTPQATSAAIDAVEAAIKAGLEGILGLHLEGPHLSLARKGAHDPALIRPMEDADLATLLQAAKRLPLVKVTLAPESVTAAQITALTEAGALVSLGHSDADFESCAKAAEAGARCVTHLFNAMSQLGSRSPGLVGAALTLDNLSAGVIADGIHIHPQSLRAAVQAKTAQTGALFLVSDAMAVAGTQLAGFTLNARQINRRDGRLTLADGTLAGADLDLPTALRNLVNWGISSEDQALKMVTTIPATLAGQAPLYGRLTAGSRADFLHFPDLLNGAPTVWRGGKPVATAPT